MINVRVVQVFLHNEFSMKIRCGGILELLSHLSYKYVGFKFIILFK